MGTGVLTDEIKERIDGMSREEMARKWRFAPVGDPMFQGEVGDYFTARFNELGGFSPEISKKIGGEMADPKVLSPREIAERINGYARECLICYKPDYAVIDMGEKLIADAVTAIRDAVREEDCKAMCEFCAADDSAEMRQEGKVRYHVYHHHDHSRAEPFNHFERCRAAPILALVEEEEGG